MYRCALPAVFLAALAFALPASAQVQRGFPQNALRGVVVFGQPPEVTMNDQATRLAPGSRIRGQNNLLEMSGALIGVKAHVNYTIDASGLVRDVWILRPEEVAIKPWPVTLQQAQTWAFDPVAQRWTKP
jgi:hypothetical protein